MISENFKFNACGFTHLKVCIESICDALCLVLGHNRKGPTLSLAQRSRSMGNSELDLSTETHTIIAVFDLLTF